MSEQDEEMLNLQDEVKMLRALIAGAKAACTPGPDVARLPEAARAAYEARIRTRHEPGTWPAFRDGYAAGLAARMPGPATAKLIEELDRWHSAEDPLYADEHACPLMLGSEVVALLAELGRNPPPLKPYLGDEAAHPE